MLPTTRDEFVAWYISVPPSSEFLQLLVTNTVGNRSSVRIVDEWIVDNIAWLKEFITIAEPSEYFQGLTLRICHFEWCIYRTEPQYPFILKSLTNVPFGL